MVTNKPIKKPALVMPAGLPPTNEFEKAGENILVAEKDGFLFLVIREEVDLGPSKSGKMNAVASTSGFVRLPNGMRLNLWLGIKS